MKTQRGGKNTRWRSPPCKPRIRLDKNKIAYRDYVSYGKGKRDGDGERVALSF